MADAGEPGCARCLRVQIDSVDARIVELLAERARIAASIALVRG
jgi:chorismate mutase